MEHVLGLFVHLIASWIPDTPWGVHNALKKREYERKQEVAKMRKVARDNAHSRTSTSDVQSNLEKKVHNA